MRRENWRTLVLFLLLLGTVFDLFLSPWFLIPNLIALGVFMFVITRQRK